MRKIILFFCLLLSFSVSAQLVNIESKRMQTDSIRFVLNADFSFNHANNDGKTVNQIDGSLTTQLKSKDLRKIFFFIGNYKLIDADQENLQNGWFLHGRFNYKLNRLLRLEAFVQSQYNQLLTIEQRNLAGAGVRFKLFDNDQFSGYLGNSYMYEIEYSKDPDETFHNHRNSSYLTLGYTPKSERFSLANTVYYQPLYKNFKDYRLLEQFRLDVPFSKVFRVFLLYNYYLDQIIPLNKTEYTSNINFGLGISI